MKLIFTKTLIISIFLYLFPLFLSAQNVTIEGKITDQNTNEPLIGATIKSGTKGVISDIDGLYTISLSEGKHTIQISFIGYASITKTVDLKSGEAHRLDIQLSDQTTMLQTATVTSGKFEKPLGEVTVSMEVLKPRLMESINSTAVDDALQKIPGVTIIDGQANIRGGSGWSYGSGSRVLLLIDDIPALQADAGRPNWNDYPIENTEQIEIIKGAASALYGSSAMNGIINIRTAYAKSKPETKISTFFTSYFDPKNKDQIWYTEQPLKTGLSFSHQQKVNKFDLVFGGFGLYEDEFREKSFARYGRLSAKVRYRIKDNLSVGVNTSFNKTKSSSYFYWKGWEEDALRGAETAFSSEKANRLNIDPFVNYFDDKGNRHKFNGRIYIIDNDNSGNNSNQSQLYYGEYQYQKRMDDIDLVMTTGIVGTTSGTQADIYSDTTFSASNLAGYLQLDKKLFGKLNLSAGARYERNTLISPEVVGTDSIPDGKSVESKPVFRFGLNYQIGQGTFLRASWGQGYRFPTIAEKFVSTTAGSVRVVPNPKLESETGWTTEIGIKQGFKVNNWSGYLDVAAFWSEYDNMMEYTFVPSQLAFQSQNVGGTAIKGIDIGIAGEGKFDNITLYVIGGYTYIDPKFREYDPLGNDILEPVDTEGKANARSSSADYNILKYRNKHSAKLDVEVKYKSFSIGVAGLYVSHMEAIDFIFEQTIPGLKQNRIDDTNGSKIFDIRFAYEINKHAKVSFLFNNIFNEAYTLRPAFLEAPRNATFRFDYKF
jgi:outer membrane receptor protein involved in Fe transport